MKKIGLYLSLGPHAGGSFQYCLSVIKYLQNLDKNKYEIIVFTKNNLWKKRLNKNIKIIKIHKNKTSERILNYLSIFIPVNIGKFLYDKLSKNIKAINNSCCDFILFPAQENLSSKVKIKSITTIHDLMHRYEKRFKEYSLVERFKRDYSYNDICKNSQIIIVDSNIGKKHVIESFGIDQRKIILAPFKPPSYLKKSKIIDIYKKYNIPKNKFIFYPAQFWEHKNHINLIKAFDLLQRKINKINLVFVGAEKNNLKNIHKEIINLNLSKKIFILGYIDEKDMYSFYKKASLTSFVSYCGPTNIPPLEAMFTGCPLVCSNVYGMKDQVKDAALFINPNSYKDIYKKILTVLKNKKLRKKIIRNGFRIIEKNKKHKFLSSLDKILK